MQKLILLILAIVCIPLIGMTQQFYGTGGKYAREGYNVQCMDRMLDTQTIQDPITGEYMMKVRVPFMEPVSVNGEKIYRYADVTKHARQRREREPLEDYILKKVAKRLSVLPDGYYRINMRNVVVNKNGEIVYYELDGIVGRRKVEIPYGSYYREDINVSHTIKESIDNEVKAIVNSAPSMKPAKIKGKRVPYLTDVYLSDITIEMHNGEPTFLFRDTLPL